MGCGSPQQSVPEGPNAQACATPTQRTTLVERDGAVLEIWRFRQEVVTTAELPNDPAFRAYRAAIVRDGADLRRPVADPPVIETEAQASIWRDEDHNNVMAYDSGVGAIEPISCLNALLFARQASRVSQVDRPTEFVASALRRESQSGTDVIVVFGAGSEMFVPREIYGLEVVEPLLAEGWSFRYSIHNHTLQRNGNLLALGVPVPSTSDVQLSRSLADRFEMDSVKVTNGFYTFRGSIADL